MRRLAMLLGMFVPALGMAIDAPCGQLHVSEREFVVVVQAIGQKPITLPSSLAKGEALRLDITGKPSSLYIKSADGQRQLAVWTGESWPRCIDVTVRE